MPLKSRIKNLLRKEPTEGPGQPVNASPELVAGHIPEEGARLSSRMLNALLVARASGLQTLTSSSQ